MSLYEPSRGGTRGGKDQFVWENVKVDKYRENYLAHSLMAPVGRWQKGKDLTWYTKESKVTGKKEALKQELASIKEAEEDAMARALGLKASVKKTPGNLTKRDMMEVCKRRTADEAEAKGQIRMEGIGYKNQKNALMGMSNPKDGATTFEGESTNAAGDRLVLRRVSERSERESVSSVDKQLVQSTELQHTELETTDVSDKRKEKKLKKHKKDKKDKKRRKHKEKGRDKHSKQTDKLQDCSSDDDCDEDTRRHHYKKDKRKKHKRKRVTDLSNDSSSDNDASHRKPSHKEQARYQKKRRHDTDSD